MEKALEIAEFVITELDHFQSNFNPRGGALTASGDARLANEPFIGFIEALDQENRTVRIFRCRNLTP